MGLADQVSIGDIEAWHLLVFFLAVLVSFAAGRLARFVMKLSAERADTAGREWLAVLLRSVARSIILLAFTFGFNLWFRLEDEYLKDASGALHSILDGALRILNAAAVGYAIYRLVDIVDHYLIRLARRTESKVDDVLAPIVGKSIRLTVLALVVLNVAHVVSGKNMTTILAGLGVGGLAFALAGQDTIKNFFGSVVILSDRPYEIGDRILFDGHDGPVESVGFRSTKIRTLNGHLVTIPNSEIVSKSVQNIGKRPYIRRLANITITYDTPPRKIGRAVDILTEILTDHDGMSPDFPPRVFFNDFNDCSLNIIMIYWYHPPDYWKYMEFSERVNMSILTRFNDEGIEFAFPSQTVYLANDDKRQLALRMLREQT